MTLLVFVLPADSGEKISLGEWEPELAMEREGEGGQVYRATCPRAVLGWRGWCVLWRRWMDGRGVDVGGWRGMAVIDRAGLGQGGCCRTELKAMGCISAEQASTL